RRIAEALVRLHADHHAQPPRRAVVQRRLAPADERLRAEGEGHVERLANVEAEEIRRRHADDGERDAIQRDCAADGVRHATESLLPVAITDHRDGTVLTTAALIIASRQRTAEERRRA